MPSKRQLAEFALAESEFADKIIDEMFGGKLL